MIPFHGMTYLLFSGSEYILDFDMPIPNVMKAIIAGIPVYVIKERQFIKQNMQFYILSDIVL